MGASAVWDAFWYGDLEFKEPHKFRDELKKEKKEYLIKLQELNRQVKERNRRDINFKGTVEQI